MAPSVPVPGGAGSLPKSSSLGKSPSRSPALKPFTPSSVPTADDSLADAITKIDSLRLSQPPSQTSSPVSKSAPASRRASGTNLSELGAGKSISPATTPHFGAQSDL
jgi:hypothetical protein